MASKTGERYKETIYYRGTFPYLDVAQRYNVPYRWVLSLADELDRLGAEATTGSVDWFNATFIAWVKEKYRRRGVNPEYKH